MGRPVIGLTSETIPPSQWTYDAGFAAPGQAFYTAAKDYSDSIEKAGGISVILPNTENIDAARAVWERMDGFIVTGGNDVSPSCYGEENTGCGELDTIRDTYEFELIRYAIKVKKPIWGICRGNQVFNVCMGGTLHQDLVKAGLKQHMIITPETNREATTHRIDIVPDSILFRALGTGNTAVNSYHHQGVKTLGKGLKVQAVSEDGIIESVSVEGHPFAITTQWHPEMMFDSELMHKLFVAFVDAARGE